jgi:hypothetical protein
MHNAVTQMAIGQAAGHAMQVHSFELRLYVVREFFCRVAARPLQIAVATGTRLLAVVNPTVSLKIMYSGNHQSGALHVPDKVKEQRARVQDAVMHGSGSICRSSSPLVNPALTSQNRTATAIGER